MKTYSAKPSEIERKWYVIDATDIVLGRLSAEVASILKGKHKPYFSPNLDCGDNVVITNCDKVYLTGNKRDKKEYFWHTGYPGGIKQRNASAIFDGKFPHRVVYKAIERMLPRSPMGRAQLKKLHVYSGSEHPHQGQKPEIIEFASKNIKNTKRS